MLGFEQFLGHSVQRETEDDNCQRKSREVSTRKWERIPSKWKQPFKKGIHASKIQANRNDCPFCEHLRNWIRACNQSNYSRRLDFVHTADHLIWQLLLFLSFFPVWNERLPHLLETSTSVCLAKISMHLIKIILIKFINFGVLSQCSVRWTRSVQIFVDQFSSESFISPSHRVLLCKTNIFDAKSLIKLKKLFCLSP